jgi:hypothetical protein
MVKSGEQLIELADLPACSRGGAAKRRTVFSSPHQK